MPGSPIKIAICGGGVGGLVLAAALSRAHNIEVDVYEAAREFTEIGAGVGVWPRAWKVLQALGLADALSEIAHMPPSDVPTFRFRKGDEPDGGFDFAELVAPGGMITLHRPDFQRVLLTYLASTRVRTHTSARLLSFAQPPSPSPISLTFANGTEATCDLLVGADGLKSTVRGEMLRAAAAALQGAEAQALLQGVEPRWSGTMAYRATIPAARLAGHRVLASPYVYLGKNTQITTYPIARGALVNFAAFTADYARADTPCPAPWVQDVPRETFRADFAAWEPEVQALLSCADATSRWAVHTTPPLATFVHGRVLLLGDAAHAMMPYQGSGAGQAIEDAHVLATLLTHDGMTRARLEGVGRVYDTVRRPVAQGAAERAAEAGVLYTLNGEGLDGEGEGREALEEVAQRLREGWRWAWETSVDADVERAVRLFEDQEAQ